MELARPMRVVTAALDGDLLAVLASADRAFTGRQLARLAGASTEGARTALARLVEQGIVDREPAGAAQMYRLNREHLAAPAVLALVGQRTVLLQRIADSLSRWDPTPAYGALFGSVARGEERADSDLDLCLVRPDGVGVDHPTWRTQIAELQREVSRWTGNDTRVLELGVADGADVTEGSVLDDVLRDGVPLTGDVSALQRLRPRRRQTRPLPSAG